MAGEARSWFDPTARAGGEENLAGWRQTSPGHESFSGTFGSVTIHRSSFSLELAQTWEDVSCTY